MGYKQCFAVCYCFKSCWVLSIIDIIIIILQLSFHSDPRLDGYPLMSSPMPTAILVGLYLLFVLVGPRIMKYREPVNVKIPMMVYNLSMVIMSYYLFHEVSVTTFCVLCNIISSYVAAVWNVRC